MPLSLSLSTCNVAADPPLHRRHFTTIAMAFSATRLPLSLPPPNTLSHHHHRYAKPPMKLHLSNPPSLRPLRLSSLDVSKEDKLPTSDQQDIDFESSSSSSDEQTQQQDIDSESSSSAEDDDKKQRRLEEERFAVLNTGIHECRSCGYRYDQAVGDPSYPIPPGFDFAKLPEDWRCPTCGAAKSFFVSKSVEIAGFAENQQYGFGGNTLTSGQKTLLIYGTLLFFFALFISGYFLQ